MNDHLSTEVSAELREAIAARKVELYNALHERDICLESAITPDDPREPLRTEAHLSCGCHWIADGFAYGRAVNPRFVVTCKEHSE